MEFIRQTDGELLGSSELIRVRGRLDGYWSTHLGQNLSGIIREGARHLRLDFSEVDYLSSAAIGELMKAYRDLQALEGSLVVVNPTAFVRQVLDITRLTPMLMREGPAPAAAPAERTTRFDFAFARFEAQELEAGATLECCIYGDETLLGRAGYEAGDARRLPLPSNRFAIGLGALGDKFEDCRTRFGEFIGLPGAVAYQPTDGTGTPDYLQAAGKIMPEILSIYGLYCDGGFERFARFEASADRGRATLSDLAHACLDIADADSAGVVMVAETTGLLGAALKRSPAATGTASGAGTIFEYPAIRNWLAFHPERVFAGDLTLIAGVVSQKPQAQMARLLRPLAVPDGVQGHFHGAAFSYRPLRKGRLDLKATVATLFETSQLHGVMHLISDTREIAGSGQSEFVRGACWVSPIS